MRRPRLIDPLIAAHIALGATGLLTGVVSAGRENDPGARRADIVAASRHDGFEVPMFVGEAASRILPVALGAAALLLVLAYAALDARLAARLTGRSLTGRSPAGRSRAEDGRAAAWWLAMLRCTLAGAAAAAGGAAVIWFAGTLLTDALAGPGQTALGRYVAGPGMVAIAVTVWTALCGSVTTWIKGAMAVSGVPRLRSAIRPAWGVMTAAPGRTVAAHLAANLLLVAGPASLIVAARLATGGAAALVLASLLGVAAQSFGWRFLVGDAVRGAAARAGSPAAPRADGVPRLPRLPYLPSPARAAPSGPEARRRAA